MSDRNKQAQRHKEFYRELDALLDQIDDQQGLEPILSHILRRVSEDFGEAIGLESGRLYTDDGSDYVVVKSFGAKGKDLLGYRIPRDYPVFKELEPDQTTYFPPGDERVDPQVETDLGVKHFAAFLVGPGRDYIASFSLEEDADLSEALLVVNTLRHGIERRLREQELEDQLQEARSIQVSLLPQRPPEFEGFEFCGRSIPADKVGGDILDFLPLDDHLMGLVVGDASGHGLPAALQARDVVTGLRMGVEKDFKVTAVFNRLNRVIHQSGLTSRFVSVLYGELERDGNFTYVNAGHDPGLLLCADGTTQQLGSTGLVLGPIADLQYRRAFAHFDPGDTLLLYSDGIIERQGADGQYETSRMEAFVRGALLEGQSLEEACNALLDDTFAFGRRQPWADDVTVMMVRRLPAD